MVVTADLRQGYEFDRIREEQTVRGEFVRMAFDSELAPEERELVLLAGLRALDGRSDLEVV